MFYSKKLLMINAYALLIHALLIFCEHFGKAVKILYDTIYDAR